MPRNKVFKKTLTQRSRAVTATCFECNRTVGFTYDIKMNIETANMEFFKTEYLIPNPKLRCPSCKKEMNIYSNAVGRMNKVLINSIESNPNNYHRVEYLEGKSNGLVLINHELVQSYTYPNYILTVKDHIKHWYDIYELIISISLDDEFKYEDKPIFDAIMQMTDEDTYVITIFTVKDRITDKYMSENIANEVSFINYLTKAFLNYLDYIAGELELLLSNRDKNEMD